MKTNTDNRLSDADVEKYAVLRYAEKKIIARAVDASLSSVDNVLQGLQKIKSDKSKAIIKEAERLLKAMK